MPSEKLTDRRVQAVKAAAGERLELFDTDTKGLLLRIGGDTKTWFVRYRLPDGRQPRFKLGDYPTLSLRQAREAASDARRRAGRGDDPADAKREAEREAKSQPLKTYDQLTTAYFLSCETGEWRPRNRTKRASTLAEERGLYRRHIQAPLGDLRVEKVSRDTVRALLRGLKAADKGVQANRALSLIRQTFAFALHEQRVAQSPVVGIKAVHEEKPRTRVLSDQEIATVWGALTEPGVLRRPAGDGGSDVKVYLGEPVRLALKLSLLLLTRRAEMAGMRRDELDLKQGLWLLPGERTKSTRPHAIPLSPYAASLIERAMAVADLGSETPSPFVFPSPRDRAKAITPGALSHAMRDLGLALGIESMRSHDLRRTAASVMASERLRIAPFLIGRVLGHSGETGGAAAVTLAHYALYDFLPEKRGALLSWERLLRGIVGEVAPTSTVAELRRRA